MRKTIKDSDLLSGMLMMVDYEPVVYGFDGSYYLRTSYLIDGEDVSESEKASDIWKNNSIDENLEDKNKEYIKNGCNFFSDNNVFLFNNDFRSLKINNLTDKDFVYLDPPYLNTTATYNENDGWTMKDENDLYGLCENLNNKNIKFGLSNVFVNKGVENTKIIEWCNKNNWNVYTFDKFSYMACGKGNSNAKEVFITNY